MEIYERTGKVGRPRIREAVRERIRELRAQGRTYGEIARILGVPKSTVYFICREKSVKN